MISIQHQKIIIIKSRRPVKQINQELQWFGTSLGLFNLRDKDKSCFRVFIELLKSAKLKRPMRSDEIAFSTDLSRGTVVHHINKLMESGLVVHEKRRYMLRVDNLQSLVDEIEKDINDACEELRKVAREIDLRMGL